MFLRCTLAHTHTHTRTHAHTHTHGPCWNPGSKIMFLSSTKNSLFVIHSFRRSHSHTHWGAAAAAQTAHIPQSCYSSRTGKNRVLWYMKLVTKQQRKQQPSETVWSAYHVDLFFFSFFFFFFNSKVPYYEKHVFSGLSIYKLPGWGKQAIPAWPLQPIHW